MSFRTSPANGRTRLNNASSLPQAARKRWRPGSTVVVQRLLRAAFADRPVSSFEELRASRPRPWPELLQFGDGDLGLFVLGAGQAEHRLGRPLGGVIQQALVDMADLLDVERTEAAEPAGLAAGTSPEQLQRFEQCSTVRLLTGSGWPACPSTSCPACGLRETGSGRGRTGARRRPGASSGRAATPPWTARNVASSRHQASCRRSRTSSPCWSAASCSWPRRSRRRSAGRRADRRAAAGRVPRPRTGTPAAS